MAYQEIPRSPSLERCPVATMRASARKVVFVAVKELCLVALLGIAAPVLGQEAAPQRAADVDEVVVSGRQLENLRIEIERLEADVYERFNALNSNDEFDIRCFKQAPTGSNIPLRTCAPNFVIRAESDAAGKMLTDGRNRAGNNNNPSEHAMRMEEKGRELTAEMQRVARGDERLLRDLVRLDELRQLQSSQQTQRAR
jgi:hypothetical protein